jgi:hypothetical protein
VEKLNWGWQQKIPEPGFGIWNLEFKLISRVFPIPVVILR